MTPATTRATKIIRFLAEKNLRWCTAQYCGCMGCINKDGFTLKDWARLHPDEPKITKEEYEKYKPA
jgi:hypothetical protein